MEKGDYVLATKYADGDPGDQFAVGYFVGMLPKPGGDRYEVADQAGKLFRRNGFRRCEKITHEQGVWLVSRFAEIEAGISEFYYDDDGNRHGKSLWDWFEQAKAATSSGGE